MKKNNELIIALLRLQVEALESVLSEQCAECDFAKNTYIRYAEYEAIKNMLAYL
jgi:hypothetical protein